MTEHKQDGFDELEQLANLLSSELATIHEEVWSSEMDAFRSRATAIRNILDRFHTSDLSTRRYVRQHLDEQFEALAGSYQALRRHFSDEQIAKAKEGRGQSWNGSSSLQ